MNLIDNMPNETRNHEGLPICTLCGGDRYVVNPFTGEARRCLCKCQSEAEDKKKKEEKLKQQAIQAEHNRAVSLLGKRYANATFDTADIDESNEKAYMVAKSYCEKYEEMLDKGLGFYVYGPVGTGKTHLIACVCNDLINKGESCIFTNFINISNDIKRTFGTSEASETVIDKYSKVHFLFIDDLGKESYKHTNGDASWTDEQMFVILNNRYNNMLPTIFSSNYSIKEFADKFDFDSAIVDRVKAMATKKINLTGVNRREEE